jgi:RNA polymerase sigma-70 factor (ECF subfamily)
VNEAEQLPSTAPSDDFVRMFTRYQPQIYSFIATLLPNDADADDVMAETSIVLWRKWRSFAQGEDFLRWARGVARFEVSHYRRSKSRERVMFNQSVMEMLADSLEEQAAIHDARRQALNLCKDRLAASDRQLVELRYADNRTARQVAHELGREENTVYKALGRIRRQLLECVMRRLAASEGAI